MSKPPEMLEGEEGARRVVDIDARDPARPASFASIMSRSMWAAVRPISTPDWLTVVRGGMVNDAMSMSSKPTIDSRSGTTIRAWNAA